MFRGYPVPPPWARVRWRPVTRRRIATATAVLACALAGAAPASAAVSENQAGHIASNLPAVEKALKPFHSVSGSVVRDGGSWLVRFGSGELTRAEVNLDAANGRVVYVYTGTIAAFPLARGQRSGYAARKLNSVWLWV